MNTVLLEIEKAPETFAEKLSYGGRMLLIGMGTVFSVLIILWGCLELMHFFCNLPKRKNKQPQITTPETTVEAITETKTEYDTSSEEIVAVIAAAIATAESEHPGISFRAVAFKKLS